MPRDGLSQYAPPPGTNGITNYTIESTKYNGFVADVTQDLNLPRPIVAGGTGANNARDAMTSLQGDVAYQVVTNYDAYAFVSGSFYSAAGATSAPTANAFIGQCYTSDPAVVPPAVPAGQNMFVEARDVTTGLKYLRQKTAGVWGAWAQQAGGTADLDAAYVNVSGDVMTGNLSITGTFSGLTLNHAASGGNNAIFAQLNGSNRWIMELGDTGAESGADAGSNFVLHRYHDNGTQIDTPFNIGRASGIATFSVSPVVPTPPVGDSSTKVATTAFVTKLPTIQIFVVGSGTYTSPPGVKWLRLKMVGGGGGGAGAGVSGGGNGTNGGNTVFGSSTAFGGLGATFAAPSGGAGGNYTQGTVIGGIVLQGAAGQGKVYTASSVDYPSGGAGGVSPLGGAGAGVSGGVGGNAFPATGSGGAGGGVGNTTAANTGGGGGAGAWFDVLQLPGTYAYAVGAAGGGGGGGTSGSNGGGGSSGIIIVEEYYIG